MTDFLKLLTPEERLLIALCRIEFSVQQRTEIMELIKAVTDWNAFFNIANDHGIVALCHFHLKNPEYTHLIPVVISVNLRDAYYKSLARNTIITRISDEIDSLAWQENIKIVLLKGSALERIEYGNIGLRQMYDLDILVDRNQALKLRNILIRNGFASVPFISKIYERNMFVEGKHLPELTKSGITVEIHFRLFNEMGNSLTSELFNNAISLSPESVFHYPVAIMHFLFLVKHLRKHERDGSSQLRLYADLVILSDRYQDLIINKSLSQYARAAGLDDDLSEVLGILQKFWALNVTDEADLKISASGCLKFISFLKTSESSPENKVKNNPLGTLMYIPGLWQKILFIIGYVFPSKEFLRYKYRNVRKDHVFLSYLDWWKGIFEKKF